MSYHDFMYAHYGSHAEMLAEADVDLRPRLRINLHGEDVPLDDCEFIGISEGLCGEDNYTVIFKGVTYTRTAFSK